MDYKETLLMPKTDFPMRGNLPKREPEMQKQWDEMNIYEKVQERTKGRPMYILHDGPPYANGDLHLGHALNKILKDMIVRHKSMTGFNAPYVPGWDTHGLPIEVALMKKKKIDRKKMSEAEFRDLCKQYALEQLDNQRVQFKQLGVRGDWDNPYITLDPSFEAQQIKVFGEMAKRGYIYKGKKPVYWSPSSESALAEAEIEYQDKRSPSIYVAFDVKDGKGVLDGDEKFVIWTTTPWTIPANLGIALHPDFEYAVVSTNDKKYVVASDLIEEVATAVEWDQYEVVKTFKGTDKSNGNGTRARWIDVNGEAGVPAGRSGILFLSNPGNYNHPEQLRIWPTGQNRGVENVFVNFNPAQEQEWLLEPGQTYGLKYRMYIYDGEMTPQRAERIWRDYAAPPRVEVRVNSAAS